MTTTVGSPDTNSAPSAPRAHCIADSAGGLTFDVTGAGQPGATLVLRRQGGWEPRCAAAPDPGR